MIITKDQIGSVLELNRIPSRIISIVPSQSEFLWDLGMREELVGITKFCIHPDEMFKSVRRVGGTKNVDLQLIRELKPDLIIGNKEENSKEDIETISKEFSVWMSDIVTFEDAFEMMHELGKILGKEQQAKKIVDTCIDSVSKSKKIFSFQKVAYFIWRDPWLCAGPGTFIHEVIRHTGLNNVISTERYPEISAEKLKELAPEYCLLSSEPYPFSEKHFDELKTILPNSKIILVDGEMFSWYGSRLAGLHNYLLTIGSFYRRVPKD